MDPAAVKVARQVIQSDNVFQGTVDDLATNERYDVITLIHVIEHLLDPLTTLRKCHDLLKPDGSLIISTPNSSGLGSRILKKYWRGWEPPRHIYLYNPDTLSTLVQKAGFKIESVFTPSNATLLIWSFSLKQREKITKQKKLNLLPKIIISIQSIFSWGVEYVLTRFGMKCGEVVHLVAKKDI